MSARRCVEVVCDNCSTVNDNDWSLTATDARRLSRASGWHVGLPGGRDICEECWEDGAR